MPFNASSIPAFTAALLVGLAARPGLAGVSITDGPAPSGDEARPELIQLLDTVGEWTVHSLNRTTQPRLEKHTLTVQITVQHGTRAKQTAANERAFVLLDEINQLLREDPGLYAFYTGPGRVYGARIVPFKHTKRFSPSQDKREAGIEVGIYWEAKI